MLHIGWQAHNDIRMYQVLTNGMHWYIYVRSMLAICRDLLLSTWQYEPSGKCKTLGIT